MSILLTGASGFAGAHMLKGLIDKGFGQIICPVTYSHGGNPNRLKGLINQDRLSEIRILEVDLAENELDFDALKIDLVINFASESHVDNSISYPLKFVNNNILLMINILESIRRASSQIPIIHVSTDEVYGEIAGGKRNSEWELPLRPSNPYSASKASQEELLYAYSRTFGLSAVILNITNMIGEAQNVEKFVPRAISRAHHFRPINIDTNQNGVVGSRRYIYVGDVVSAIILLIDKGLKTELGSIDRYHIGGDTSYSNFEIVKIISDILKIDPILQFAPSPRPGYDLEYNVSTDKIVRLGWTQLNSIPDALVKIINWTFNNPEWLEKD